MSDHHKISHCCTSDYYEDNNSNSFCISIYSYPHLKYIMSNEKADEIDVMFGSLFLRRVRPKNFKLMKS